MSSLHPLFPITMHTQWRHASLLQTNNNTLSWLLDPQSLTARLKNYCTNFKVELLGQKIEKCAIEEATQEVIVGTEVLVREVLLFCDDVPQVYARSLLPLASLTGDEQQLAHLGTQSLGQVLFNRQGLTRKAIEVSSFDQHSTVGKLSQYLNLTVTHPLCARRSVFIVDDKPFIVGEVFLPGAYAYENISED